MPIQLAQCWFPELAVSNAKVSNSTRKLLGFEINKMLITVKKISLLIFGTLSFPATDICPWLGFTVTGLLCRVTSGVRLLGLRLGVSVKGSC